MTTKYVCSSCFGDQDLKAWIRDAGERRGCDYCNGYDSPTCKLDEICVHIESCLKEVYGFAIDQLPYESAEGGYIGTTWTTYEILVEEVGLSLPRDRKDRLFHAILGRLTEETWCEYDWLSLDYDEALRSSWDRFCETVKHRRRFFFHAVGPDDRDSYTPASLLEAIVRISEGMNLVRELVTGTRLWRARPDIPRGRRVVAADFGPPPERFALQSNRMNPPGIPMLYLASNAKTALLETRAEESRVGQWVAERPLRILDLRRLPQVPGIFSHADRTNRLALSFLHDFAGDIMIPVERDQRVHVDYLPSQVVTEYVRDYVFDGGNVDGIAYGSTVHRSGWNVAMFLNPIDLGLEVPAWGSAPAPSLRFARALRVSE